MQYRIQEVRRVTLNGRKVKLFKAFEKADSCYIFCGQFIAPARTANKNLTQFID